MVLALAFSPSGATLASGGLDSTVKLWDPATASRAGDTVWPSPDGVPALAFAPGARQLASAGYDGTVNGSGKPRRRRRRLGRLRNARPMPARPGGRLLARRPSSCTRPARPTACPTFDPAAGCAESSEISPEGGGTRPGRRPRRPDDRHRPGSTVVVRLLDASTRARGRDPGRPRRRGPHPGLRPPGGKVLASGRLRRQGPGSATCPTRLRSDRTCGRSSGESGPADLGRVLPGWVDRWPSPRMAGSARSPCSTVDLGASPGACLDHPGAGANVAAIAFANDGRTIAMVGLDGQVALFEAATSQSLRTTLDAIPRARPWPSAPTVGSWSTGHKGRRGRPLGCRLGGRSSPP